jgi:hypothetical protein
MREGERSRAPLCRSPRGGMHRSWRTVRRVSMEGARGVVRVLVYSRIEPQRTPDETEPHWLSSRCGKDIL